MPKPRHLTFANCASALALFIAVSTGGAVAKSNWIDGRNIKPNSIPARALQNNSITSAKIKNQQVTAADVKKGSLTATVFTRSTQKQLSSIGGGTGTGGGGTCTSQDTSGCTLNPPYNETTTTFSETLGWIEWPVLDVVPKGEGLPCRILMGGVSSDLHGVWTDVRDCPRFG